MPSPQKPATRFLVTGLPRVGSNLVLHSLSVHPQILAYNELFNVHHILWGSSAVDAEPDEAYLALRNEYPLRFLEHVLAAELPGVTAVGFKLFYMQAGQEESEKFRLVWPYLQRMKGLKVVDVVRDNRLKQAFSWAKARRTSIWLRKGEDGPDPQNPFAIPFDELHGYFLWFDTMHEARSRLLRGMDTLVARYEELAEDFPDQIKRIQQHLGVPPMALPPVTRKQRTAPIASSLANYRELRERFAKTPYLKYFRMAEEEARCRRAAA
jgi:hypothetical protein